ncbi:hypothetical protein CLO12_005274 [Escherichia coli]|nr:hypothetical protein [Escherichia coli]
MNMTHSGRQFVPLPQRLALRIVVHHIQVFCICLDVERCQQVIPPVSGQGNALWQ